MEKVKHLEIYYIDNTKDEFSDYTIKEDEFSIDLENDKFSITINKKFIKKIRFKK